jgi:excinuclease ABC subunit A
VRVLPADGEPDAAATYSTTRTCPGCGTGFDEPDPRLFSYNSKHGWCPSCYGTGVALAGFDAEQTGEENAWVETGAAATCPDCHGRRLRPEALAVRFRSRNIAALSALTVADAAELLDGLTLSGREAAIGRDLLAEVRARLRFLQQVGLGYLTLDRAAPTLSGGEAQRIRLAAQLGSNLRGVCYILDEPSIGLHARDNGMLLDTLTALRDRGNSVIVVEHDEATMHRADEIIDLGPGAGIHGGRIVARGTAEALAADPASVTGRFLARPGRRPERPARPCTDAARLRIEGASLNNLNDLDLDIPLGRLVCVTGVSGSGKSTLVRDLIAASLKNLLAAERPRGGRARRAELVGCDALTG